ncbi:hypothetical protein QZH41_008446 [Actinostola sp. cb2023]|nr:hypothetical protein QZH41_008446 [Actinostola sp. cb2023]
MDLKRRGNSPDIDIVRETVRREMEGAGELAGYRYIWHALRLRHHMHVPRALDMTSSSHMVFLSMAVSVAIAEESYGWTLFALTTNYPKITAGLYLDAVQNLGGCPRIVRSDCGSENVVIAGMQCYFRAECRDEFLGEKAPTNTAPPPLTKELRDGGHPLEGVDPTIFNCIMPRCLIYLAVGNDL